jgi:uracil-DNA glycosylase
MNTNTVERNIWFGTAGSRSPKILIVGESWGKEESILSSPFIGQSGKEFFRMLGEAFPTIAPSLHVEALAAQKFNEWVRLRDEWLIVVDILMTNVFAAHPEGNETWRFFHERRKGIELHRGLSPTQFATAELMRLKALVEHVDPKIVIACGNYALWALTDCASTSAVSTGNGASVRVPGGITSWRGSMLESVTLTQKPIHVLPILHPAAVLREWYLRAPTVHDIRRTSMALRGKWKRPAPWIIAPPTFDEARRFLSEWIVRMDSGEKLRLVNDIETARGIITCTGFADKSTFAMTIPFIRLEADRSFTSYWNNEEELVLTSLIRKALTHPNVLLEGQNYLYDTQWCQVFLGCTPRLDFDTMRAHHLLFPGTPKGLDYLSSLYCEYHWYWKDDGKEWDLKGSLEQHLLYNAEDCLRQFECGTVLRRLIEKHGLTTQWEEQKEFNLLALRMMNRGCRIDKDRRAELAVDLSAASSDFAQWFEKIIPQEIVAPKAKVPWFRSPTQQRKFFSEELGLRLPLHRKTKRETFGKEALSVLQQRHPEYTKLFEQLKSYRSVEVFHNNFVKAPLDPDQRMRCSYGIAETFRWTSSENAFGRGTNLQNIPKGEEE